MPQLDRLLKACEAMRDDLLMRADIDSDGTRAVNVSNSKWEEFNDAIDAATAVASLPTPLVGSLADIQTLKKILIMSVMNREPDFVIGDPANPYLVRYWLRRDRPEGSIYLHCIHKSDDDRALHDHPWPSTSIILQGTLREILPDGSKMLTPGCITSRSAEQAHRLEVVNGPVWTLFVTGAVEREWGFHCPNGWVHWQDFTDPGTNGQTIGRGCGE